LANRKPSNGFSIAMADSGSIRRRSCGHRTEKRRLYTHPGRMEGAEPLLAGGEAVYPGFAVGSAFCSETADAPPAPFLIVPEPSAEIFEHFPYLAGRYCRTEREERPPSSFSSRQKSERGPCWLFGNLHGTSLQ
jgi:hypothetical protein